MKDESYCKECGAQKVKEKLLAFSEKTGEPIFRMVCGAEPCHSWHEYKPNPEKRWWNMKDDYVCVKGGATTVHESWAE